MEDVIVAEINALPLDLEDAERTIRARLSLHKAKSLRTACAALGLNPQGRDASQNCKLGYISLLWNYYKAKRDGVPMTVASDEDPRVTKHCRFRLLNVMFSNDFVGRIGEAASSDDSPYWVGITRAYNEDTEQYNDFPSREERPLYRDINTRLAPNHHSSKLRVMWRTSLTRYERAMELARQANSSGQLWDYCSGHLDALYMSDWLKFHSNRDRAVPGLVHLRDRAVPGLVHLRDRAVPGLAPIRANTSGWGDAAERSSLVSSDEDRPAKRPRQMSRIVEVLNQDRENRLAQREKEDSDETSRWDAVVRSSAAVKAASAALDSLRASRGEGAPLEAAERAVNKLVSRWIQTMEEAS